jgi:adenine-specific DNA-methyltransferase
MATKDYSLLSREELVSILLKYDEKKKYGIVWDEERVPEKVVTDCQTHLPVLTEVKDKEIITNPSQLTHLLIEGDNFHTLSVLNYTHHGKIDLIYIDPPYNTGNKDFIYNDKYVDTVDTYRHSKWLNFMNKRLELAHNLLADDGVIFISIDDNEVAQLKMLCNKIFKEKNFVGQWNWFKSATPPNLSLKVKKNLEYILVYEKVKDSTKYKGIKKNSKSDDPFTKPQNSIKILTFPAKSINFKTEKREVKAGIYGTEKFPNKLLNDVKIKNFTNENEAIFENRFIWTQDKLNDELENKTIVNCSKTFVLSYKKQNYSEEVPPNLIDENVGIGTTEEAGKRLFEMFDKKTFDYPKPVQLIKYLLSFKPKNNPIILDFFAGSGTTAQAVLELNKEDGGKRQFILATNNENNNGFGKILDDVCYPRIQKVFKGYKNNKNEEIDGLGGNLKYFKTSFVENSKNRDMIRLNITKKCTQMLCVKDGIYDLFKESSDWKIFKNEDNFMAIFYDFPSYSLEQLVNELNQIKGNKKLYCFALGDRVDTITELYELIDCSIEAIPQKLLEVYFEIFALKDEK